MLTIDRDRFIEELNARNVGNSVHFIPVHLMSIYRNTFGLKEGDFPKAEKHFERLISLPLYPSLSMEDAQYVVDAVRDIVTKYHR
ncbi:MAG: DegT/DnrJ/EryC1/StrS family aminotransferase [Acutalibacteraceae bacterium]